MLNINNEWLDEWCKNISDKYEIESGFATDNEVYIGLSPNKLVESLYENECAVEIFKRLMPDDLFQHYLCMNLKLTFGSIKFNTINGKHSVIGYVITLRS